jgi:hypothetical protein
VNDWPQFPYAQINIAHTAGLEKQAAARAAGDGAYRVLPALAAHRAAKRAGRRDRIAKVRSLLRRPTGRGLGNRGRSGAVAPTNSCVRTGAEQ